MMFRSIRSRLALSFAGIALVAALSLGVVLLAILRNYYSNLEFDYLRTNAQAIGGLVVAMNAKNVPHDEVQSQIENMAFLTQTRIQVFSSDNALLYDSGSPQNLDVNLGVMKPMIALKLKGDTPAGESFISVAPKNDVLLPAPGVDSASQPVQNQVFVYSSNPPQGPTFGFAMKGEAITGGARSQLAVTLPARTVDVRVSEGPAYGSAILTSVALGWAFASAIAVLLAAVVGWYISRRVSAPVLALTDVTTRMAQGELSSRAVVRSRDEFGQLARSFNEMADQVETTVTTLRHFISDAAHELRTPLTALRTNLDLARDEQDASNRTAFIERAQAMVLRLDELNTNLLDLSRLETNSHTIRESLVDLSDLLRSRSELYASQAEQAELNLEMDLPPEPVLIRADAGQITRAVDNLLDNACKFTPPGGTVRVALSQQAGQVIFTVSDTGIGIPADELPQVFNRFHRGRNTTQYLGSGLGLAIVKAIVAAHEGSVEVRSSGEGKGSQFSIRLPAASHSDP